MMHPQSDAIFSVAYKEALGEKLTKEEVEMKNHFLVCEDCKNLFLSYLTQTLVVTGKPFEQFLYQEKQARQKEDSLSPNAGISTSQKVTPNSAEEREEVLYQINLMIEGLAKQVVLQQYFAAASCQPFVMAKASASRGGEDKEVRMVSGSSLISYDKETACLSISLDQEDYPHGNLKAILSEEDGTREQELLDSGFDTWECEFTNVYENAVLEIKEV